MKLLQNFKKFKEKKTFHYNILSLVGGTAGAQFLTLIAAPILTRLYTPEQFGSLSLFTSILAIMAVVACLRYEVAIPLPKYKKEANILVQVSFLILACTTIISLFVIIAIHFFELNTSTVSLELYQLYLLPLGLLLTGSYQILSFWALREKQFTALAKTKLTQSAGSIAMQLSCYKIGVLALLLGQLASQSLGIIKLSKVAIRTNLNFKYSKKYIFYTLKKYRKFPLLESITALFNATGSRLPILLLSVFFNIKTAGVYALAEKILYLPISLIGNSFGNVFFSEASEAKRNGKLNNLVFDMYKQLTIISMPPMMLIIFSGPLLFSLIFGEAWVDVGLFAQWMAPWLFFVFITSPISTLFIILDKQQYGVLFQVAMFLIRCIALYIGYLYKSPIVAIALFSISSSIIWITTLLYFFIKTKVNIIKSTLFFIKNIFISFLLCSPTLYIYYTDLSNKYIQLIGLLIISISFIFIRYYIYIKANK